MFDAKGIKPTDRVKGLREEIVMAEPSVCSERAVIVTKSYAATEGMPMVIRRAKAISDVLNQMTVRVWKNELIVGNQASRRRAAPVFPEWGVYWLEKQLDEIETRPQDRMAVPAAVKAPFPIREGGGVAKGNPGDRFIKCFLILVVKNHG